MDNISYIATIIGVIATLTGILLAFGKVFISIGAHRERINSTENRTSTIENDFKDISKGLSVIEGKVSIIASSLVTSQSKELLLGKSPLQLTEEAETIVKKYNLTEAITDNWAALSGSITEELKGSQNAYDIQQACYVVFLQYFNQNKFGDTHTEKIKNAAFNASLNLNSVLSIISVIARDTYFKEHSIAIDPTS